MERINKKSYKYVEETKGMAVVRFYVEHFEKHSTGHGVAGITCDKLWDMEDDEFNELFN